jgi:hypothetical protein
MTRHYIASTEFGQMRSPSAWVRIHEHLIRGDEVVVTHYRKPVALITPYPVDPPNGK